eukprot:TRINITY_DN10311_c0_g1_i1.p1 TRINITY_DN10311_c0_g1~~TRINITY_DN10311_c0_g1_i1.p1  ORF type:complete len:488 (+),score=60.70 TRINITY_DN10311_c0_g1_i1:38-1501(+)
MLLYTWLYIVVLFFMVITSYTTFTHFERSLTNASLSTPNKYCVYKPINPICGSCDIFAYSFLYMKDGLVDIDIAIYNGYNLQYAELTNMTDNFFNMISFNLEIGSIEPSSYFQSEYGKTIVKKLNTGGNIRSIIGPGKYIIRMFEDNVKLNNIVNISSNELILAINVNEDFYITYKTIFIRETLSGYENKNTTIYNNVELNSSTVFNISYPKYCISDNTDVSCSVYQECDTFGHITTFGWDNGIYTGGVGGIVTSYARLDDDIELNDIYFDTETGTFKGSSLFLDITSVSYMATKTIYTSISYNTIPIKKGSKYLLRATNRFDTGFTGKSFYNESNLQEYVDLIFSTADPDNKGFVNISYISQIDCNSDFVITKEEALYYYSTSIKKGYYLNHDEGYFTLEILEESPEVKIKWNPILLCYQGMVSDTCFGTMSWNICLDDCDIICEQKTTQIDETILTEEESLTEVNIGTIIILSRIAITTIILMVY